MSLTLDLPAEYGLVLAVASSSLFIGSLHTYLTGMRRKASGQKYPIAYASNELAAKDRKAYLFNSAQRAHANFTENHTSFLFGLLISGLRYPTAAAGLGAGWVLARIVYAIGYSSNGPEGRHGSSLAGFLFDASLKFTAAYTTAMMVLGQ